LVTKVIERDWGVDATVPVEVEEGGDEEVPVGLGVWVAVDVRLGMLFRLSVKLSDPDAVGLGDVGDVPEGVGVVVGDAVGLHVGVIDSVEAGVELSGLVELEDGEDDGVPVGLMSGFGCSSESLSNSMTLMC
jgi:hypothetical protein